MGVGFSLGEGSVFGICFGFFYLSIFAAFFILCFGRSGFVVFVDSVLSLD